MSEFVIENSVPQETVIVIEGGPELTTTVSQELQTVIAMPVDPIIIDLNSGARGEPGSAIHTGPAHPTGLIGTDGDIYIVTEGDVQPGFVFEKRNGFWVESGNIRGPAGGIEVVNGYTGPGVDLNKADIGLPNVDNTADLDKPVSTATQAEIDAEISTTVKLTGAQTIAGEKTFSSRIQASGRSQLINNSDDLSQLGATLVLENATQHPSLYFLSTGIADAQLRLNRTNGRLQLVDAAGTALSAAGIEAQVLRAVTLYGDGSNITALNGSQVTTGTVADARLSSNVALLNGAQTFSGAKTFASGVLTASSPSLIQPKVSPSSDHGYISFFARDAAPTTRSAYVGVASAASVDFSITNEMALGKIRLDGPGGTLVTNGLIVSTGVISGNGSGLTNLNGSNVSSGTVADERLSANVALKTGATFTGPVVVPTPTAVDHAATKAYVDGIVDAAPGTLDTLNELAAALGDDPNFATTVTNSIATKVSLTGNETIAGVKTFSSAPVVPLNSFEIDKISGLQGALDLKAPLSSPTFSGTVTGTFSGSGAALTSLNGSNISTGTVADAHLSTNVALLNTAETVSGVWTFTGASLNVRPAGTAIVQIGRVDGVASTPRIEFNSGATAVDYDTRIYAGGGTGVAGEGTLYVTAATLNVTGSVVADSFSGIGTSLTTLNGTNITTGTVADARIATSIARLASPAFTGTPTAPTPATTDNDTQVATTAFVKAALLAANPVGAIYFTTVNTNPSTFIGGTWAAWGTGRVPVGVDTAQTEFNTVEKTGGAKTHTLSVTEMPSHTHTQNAHSHTGGDNGHAHNYNMGWGEAGSPHNWQFANGTGRTLYVPDFVYATAVNYASIYINNATATNQNTGGGGAHNNLQPYITCYMWKRTA